MDENNAIEQLASKARKKLGLSHPPVDPIKALEGYQLSLPDEPLEEILAGAGLTDDQITKIDAMVDMRDKSVYVREGMHDRQKNWGYLHELAHRVVPTHRDLLYRCSIFRLSPSVQKQFEREADEFAAEVFFFGKEFIEDAMSLPFGLSSPLQLANGRYDVSLHAAFNRYVKQNPNNCCLLISSPVDSKNIGMSDIELKYYIPSNGFKVHIPPHQKASFDSNVGALFNSGKLSSVTEHEFILGGENTRIFDANSFTNGYNIFTLIWNPRPTKIDRE